MSEYVENVKAIHAFFRDQARDARGHWREKFSTLEAKAEAVQKELVRLYGLTSALPPELGNIHDLPPDLIEELSVSKSDELDDQIVTVINAYGGEASLDQVLVGLYRKFKISQKRRFMQNKLYRMETIWGVPGKKGIYTTVEPVTVEERMNKVVEKLAYPKGQKEPSGNHSSQPEKPQVRSRTYRTPLASQDVSLPEGVILPDTNEDPEIPF